MKKINYEFKQCFVRALAQINVEKDITAIPIKNYTSFGVWMMQLLSGRNLYFDSCLKSCKCKP